MTSIRVLILRFLGMLRGSRRDAALSDEIRTHLDLLAADHERRGMSPGDARLAARRAFGGVDQVKAVYRDQRGLPIVDALTQDVRFAFRLLARDRGFAITAVLVLGVGIGVNNMLFTILYAHTMRGLPIDRVDEVLYLSTQDERNSDQGLSHADFEDIRAAAPNAAEGVMAFTPAPIVVGDEGRAPDRVDGMYVSANAFALVAPPPIQGRAFGDEEDGARSPLATVISRGAWQDRYAGEQNILGRQILVNGAPATVVGVLPDRSGFPLTAQIWLPLSHGPGAAEPSRSARPLRLLARVREGVSVPGARAELAAIVDRISRDHPETSQGLRARVVPVNDHYLARPSDPAWRAFISVGFLVLLISCANVANLMLARSVTRAREIAVRTSLGASRRQIVRQLLIQSSVLALLGGALGLGVAMVGARLFSGAIPDGVLPYWLAYTMDAKVIAALIAVSFGTILVFGLVPALSASRVDTNRVLKDGGRGGTAHRSAQRWTATFLTAELALAVVMLANVTFGLRYAGSNVASDEAIDTPDVVTASIALSGEKYRTSEARSAFYARLIERLAVVPGVSSASVTSALPLRGAAERRLELASRPRGSGELAPEVRSVTIAPRYFETLALPMTRGREFTDIDGTPGQTHAIVNERFAELFFADEDPLGQRIAMSTPNAPASPVEWLTIVGVAPVVRQRLRNDPDPIVYLPYRAAPPPVAALLVRSNRERGALASVLRDEVAAVDPELPLYRMMTMARAVDEAGWTGRVSSMLIMTLTLLAVGLCTVGLYAVMAYAVTQRRREIGVRMALGARPQQVRTWMLRQVVIQVAFGLGVGLLCTLAWDRIFPSEARTASGGLLDVSSLVVVAAALGLVAAVASFQPVRRATLLDPLTVLRHE